MKVIAHGEDNVLIVEITRGEWHHITGLPSLPNRGTSVEIPEEVVNCRHNKRKLRDWAKTIQSMIKHAEAS